MYLCHPDSTSEFNKSDMGSSLISQILRLISDKSASNTVIMFTLRSICNLFKNQSSNNVAFSNKEKIIDSILPFISNSDKNVRLAAISSLLNFSVEFLNRKGQNYD